MTNRIFVLRSSKVRVFRRTANATSTFEVATRDEASREIVHNLHVEVEENPSRSLLKSIANDSDVLGHALAMPLKLVEPFDAEPSFVPEVAGTTWGIDAVGGVTTPYNGKGVTVAVLDTGIDATHSAFSSVALIQKDFTGIGDGDQHGHGTHCAGTIFGRDLGELRIGIARGVTRALIAKVLGAAGRGGGSDVLCEAMLWAHREEANLISMSLGIDFPGFVEQQVRKNGLRIPEATSMALEAYRANVRLFEQLIGLIGASSAAWGAEPLLIVAATGNESRRDQVPPFEISVAPPAAASGVIAVGALGQTSAGLKIAPFSNVRATISAPGVNIVSARIGGGTQSLSGTSMATPHVAGVAALWIEKLKAQGTVNPTILNARVIGSGTMKALVPESDPVDVGAGLVQAPQAN